MIKSTGVRPTSRKSFRWRFSRQEIRKAQVLFYCVGGPFFDRWIRLTRGTQHTAIFSVKGFCGRYVFSHARKLIWEKHESIGENYESSKQTRIRR